jgi:sodium/proline symporter
MAWKISGVALYLGILVLIGVLASRRMKNLRDYFAGGKQLGFLAVAFSARATGESAWLLLGLTGMGAAVGMKAFWVVLGETVGVAGAWFLMSRRFKRLTDRYDAITVPDYLEARFRDGGHLLRIASAGCLVVFITIYVSAQIDATGAAFESFLGWNYYVGALVGFCVVAAYIVTGGFVAVVWSDVFQGTLMVVGLVVLPIVGVIAAGGPGAVLDGMRQADPALLTAFGSVDATVFDVLGTLGLALIGLGFMGSPQIFVRFLALRDEKEISQGALVAIVWTILADGGAVVVGMVGRTLLVGQDLGNGSQDVLPLLVEHLMPAFLVGLYIAIVLSAIMSTVDSLLVLASSAVVRDGYQQILHPEMPDEALVKRSRSTTLVLAAAGLVLALAVAALVPGRTVFWFVMFGWSGIAATFCPTMILSLYWSGFTRNGALASMLSGFLCVPLLKFVGPSLGAIGPYLEAITELPIAFTVASIVGVVVSKVDSAGAEQVKETAADLEWAAAERVD